MSDPAVEAARRAWLMDGRSAPSPSLGFDLSVDAAREVLAPLRELHQPNTNEHTTSILACRLCAVGPHHAIGCAECWTPWPCDTARLIYTSEEL